MLRMADIDDLPCRHTTKMESLSGIEKDGGRPFTLKAHTKMESLSGVENGRRRRPTLKTHNQNGESLRCSGQWSTIYSEGTHQNGESLSGVEKDGGRPSPLNAHQNGESITGIQKDSSHHLQ